MTRTRLILSTALLVLAGCQQAPPIPEEPVNLRPTVNVVAEPDSGPAPLSVILSAEASDPEGQPLTYRWFVDGEEPQEGKMFSYVFEEVGPHLVEVVASDGELDSEPDTVEILVRKVDGPEF